MRLRSLATAFATVTLVAGVGATTASATTTTFDVPVNGVVFNDCTGEAVVINGTTHMKVTDNTSLTTLKSQIESNLTGVKGLTPTGVRYVMNDQLSDMQHADFDPFGNVQMTLEQSTLLTRQGEGGALVTGDDFRLHVLTHLTISNGIPRADSQDLRADCR